MNAVVIGAGVGGLSAAAYLARDGYDVTILEKNGHVGGVMNRIERDGYTFDMGPTWYLESEIYDSFFADFGHSRDEFYTLSRLDPYMTAFFEDSTLSVSPGNTELYDYLDRPDRFRSYLTSGRENYRIATSVAYERTTSVWDYLTRDTLTALRKPHMLAPLSTYTSLKFRSRRAKELAEIPVTFLGTNPAEAPAFYSLMAHVLYEKGVYYPSGGMHTIPQALAEVATEQGADIKCHEPVEAIGPGPVVETATQVYEPDVVVSNANPDYTELELVGADSRRDYWDSRAYSPSAFIMYVGTTQRLPKLGHQNFVIQNIDGHTKAVYETDSWTDQPSYYVCKPSATDPTVAPDGCESLFVFVPISRKLSVENGTRTAYSQLVLAHLSALVGRELEPAVLETFTIPDFKSVYNYRKGSALGLRHTLRQTGTLRPSRESPTIEGLYFTGSFTSPGVGVPMSVKSGELTAAQVAAG